MVTDFGGGGKTKLALGQAEKNNKKVREFSRTSADRSLCLVDGSGWTEVHGLRALAHAVGLDLEADLLAVHQRVHAGTFNG